MTDTVIILNLLTDEHDPSLDKLSEGLNDFHKRSRKQKVLKSGTVVETINVAKYLSACNDDQLYAVGTEGLEELDAIRLKLYQSKQIVVTAHGKQDCTDYCYNAGYSQGGGGRIASTAQLGKFLRALLYPGGNYNFDLMICYGARTSSHLTGQQDVTDIQELATSFAYKLFKELKKVKLNVMITGRTGACGWDSTTKQVTVESDEVTVMRNRLKELTADWKRAIEVTKSYDKTLGNQLFQKFYRSTVEEIEQIDAVGQAEEDFKARFLARVRRLDYKGIIETTPDMGNNYGTITYADDAPDITIANLGTNRILYHDALV